MMKRVMGALALLAVSGCGTVNHTRMVAATDYAASKHVYVAASPTPLLVGPDTVRTYSPDSSTVFVCGDGSVRDASQVAPGSKPACL
jgi:hypothetical protein